VFRVLLMNGESKKVLDGSLKRRSGGREASRFILSFSRVIRNDG